MTTIKTDNLEGVKVKVKKEVDPMIAFMKAVGMEIPEEITEEFYKGEYEITAKIDEDFKFTKRHSGENAQELLKKDTAQLPGLLEGLDDSLELFVIEVKKGTDLGEILIDEAFDENGIFEYIVDTDDFVIVQ